MSQFWYKAGAKFSNTLLQGFFAGVLLYCFINIFYWMEGSFSVSEMGKSFEETAVFFQQVEDIVREKISYEQNKELFERNGEFDDRKEIDIRQYSSGMQDSANVNLNTTYFLCDLIAFYTNGQQKMWERIQRLQNQNLSDQEIGEQLAQDAQTLETILPVSGGSLSDYARISNHPATALLEYYQNLCETSEDIYWRYQEYQYADEETEGEENSEAPSNVRYYIENTNTKQRYTNLGVKSYPAAQRMIQNSDDLDFLYMGERSFNIMVANTEYIMNDEAAQWFISARFLGAGEKVLLAVNTDYPIGDNLQASWQAFERREPIIVFSITAAVVSLIALIVLAVISVNTAGRRKKDGELILNGFDRVPTEIAAGLCFITAIIWYFFMDSFGDGMDPRYLAEYYPRQLWFIGTAVTEYWIFLFSLLSLIRRIKAGNLWTNSVCYAVILGSRGVYRARRSSKRLLIAYVVFFALNLFFLRFFGSAGVLMALVLDMAVLLYLMRDEVGNQSVQEGLYQISQGKLDYKIDTHVLTGNSLEMAKAVNEMGDGLQSAVDSIIKNERLKAELITNVSHDIKTPLTSIINYVDLLKREDIQDDRVKDYISVLDQKSQRLKQLTEDLIEASKINSGNIELHRMELRLQPMLQQSYGEFAQRLEEKQLEPVLELDTEPVSVWADGRQLWRIFENLLSNIVKYAMPQTRVYMVLKKVDDLAEITFKNVSRQKLAQSAEELQERFVRGDLSRNTEGSGLGLSIAKSLTELMDGNFEVYLDGDAFQVTLLFPVYHHDL